MEGKKAIFGIGRIFFRDAQLRLRLSLDCKNISISIPSDTFPEAGVESLS